MAEKQPTPKEMLDRIDYQPPHVDWMETPLDIRKGMYCYAANPKSVATLGLPNARPWNPLDADWKLPENWQQIIHEGFKERLERFRSVKVFMDICVRCGACADKCHYFIGTGDPKNMPVLRAELLRSVYRNDFTRLGKLLGKANGARPLTLDVLKEWWYYLFQCSECRRCSLFCPYGIDTAEITIFGRELLNLVGLNIDWIATPVSNCYMNGNHLGIQPHAFKDMLDFFVDDIEEKTGVKVAPKYMKKGADILFITPSGDVFADPGTYTAMGYMMLFHYLEEKYGLDVTWSTYASEGGNFGFFTSHETMKRLNAKMYAEAKRLGVKWILGGECGHMWRVINQYMDTMNGPADFLDVPVNPITGTRFESARSTKMVHITEFTADLIRNGKLDLDPARNDARDGALRGAAVCDQQRLQALLRDAGQHDPGADLLLRQRRRTQCRGEHGAAPERGAAAGQRRQARAREIRGQHARLRLRHRPRGAADPDGLLGAGGPGHGGPRARGQCPEPARPSRAHHQPAGRGPRGAEGASGG